MTWSNSVSARWRLSVGALMVLSLVACGGGGKKSSSPTPSSKISLGGVVSKGLTGNALVKVYGVTSAGTLDTGNVLATGQTNDNGGYSTSEFLPPSTYVVEVMAKDCANTSSGSGCSFHLNEKTSQRQYLPTGFKMRAVVTTTPANNKVNITPFSEMAVSAAETTSGGITATNANQAIAMANNLVGVTDLNAVEPTTLGNTSATADQLKLAALLAAVSNVAGETARLTDVGCTAPAGTPEATKCVVEKLAANATVTNYVGRDQDVTTALNTELQNVVANNSEVQALVESTSKKLTDPTITVPTTAVATRSPIDRVKDFVNDMMSTFKTLLNSGATPGQGAALDQAHAFENAVTGTNIKALPAQRAIQVAHAAAKLWTDYEHGVTRVSLYGHESFGFPQAFEESIELGFKCTLMNGATPLTSGDPASNITHAKCYADQGMIVTGGPVFIDASTYSRSSKNVYHEFEVTRGGVATAYEITSSAREDIGTITYSNISGPTSYSFSTTNQVQASSFSGTITSTLDGVGRLDTIQIDAQIPDGFDSSGALIHQAASPNDARSHVVADAATSNVTFVDPGAINSSISAATISFTGQIDAYAGDGSTLESNLTLGNGSYVTFGSDQLNDGKLVLAMRVPAHSSYTETNLVGTLEAHRLVSGGSHAQAYGSMKFDGKLYNGPATGTPFISGAIEYALKDTNYDELQAYSTSNYQEANVTFDLYVTAPSHPKLRFIAGMAARKTTYDYNISWDDHGSIAGNIIAYNADGSTKRDGYITVVPATTPANGKTQSVYGDATNKIKIHATDGEQYGDVLVDGAKVGVYDKDAGRITFSDGSFIIPDFGTVVY